MRARATAAIAGRIKEGCGCCGSGAIGGRCAGPSRNTRAKNSYRAACLKIRPNFDSTFMQTKLQMENGTGNESKETNGYKLGLKPPVHVEIFFDARDSSYWFRLNGRYVALGKSDLMMHLRAMGLRERIFFDGQREIDWPLWKAQVERLVDYAGPLAGHKTGIFTDGSGKKYLITDEARGVFQPAKKEKSVDLPDPKFWIEFINELLPGNQCDFFCHWLAVALRSLAANDFTPGQVCVFAGERQCGKSLLQYIITEILGGRPGAPFAYMIGETNFNRDFCGAEHWMIEDPRGSKAMQERIHFGARLKEGTVNRYYTIHAKNKDGIYLPLLRRITISINMELEYLSVLPPMDHSIADKISLFLCSAVQKAFLPFRDKKTSELSREKIWTRVTEEMPAIRAWLLKHYRASYIPTNFRDDRFVVSAFHHPELLHSLSSLSHENRLLELIDDLYFSDSETIQVPVEKKTGELQNALLEKNRFESEKVLRYPGACGSHLGKLARSMPERITMRRVNGYALWTINPPLLEKDKKNE